MFCHRPQPMVANVARRPQARVCCRAPEARTRMHVRPTCTR